MRSLALIAFVLLAAFDAAACGTGCSYTGARFGPDTTPDVYLLIGDVQHDDYCDRWAPDESECVDAIIERAQYTYTTGVTMAGRIPDLIITLGDQTEANVTGEQERFRDDFVEWMPALAQSRFRHVLGNHDSSSNCGKLYTYLDDPWLQAATTGATIADLHWSYDGRHSRVMGIPTIAIHDFIANCFEQPPRCYGGADAGDSCTSHLDCDHKCYEGELYYADFIDWYERQQDINAEWNNVKIEITAGHQALCKDGNCNGTDSFSTIQNMMVCSAPDAGEKCGAALPCPISGDTSNCDVDRTGYETRDFFMAELLDRENLHVWANGHNGSCDVANDCDDIPYADLIGTTDLLTVILSGPWQAGSSDVGRYQGALLTVNHDGTFSLEHIVKSSVAPVITSSATASADANTPTDVTITATDADYSSLKWTITPSNICISQSATDICCSNAETFTSCCIDSGVDGSLDVVMDVNCDAGAYTVDVELHDNVTANTVYQTIDVTVDAAADSTAPTPDPATFAVAPAAISETEISMTADTGTDPSTPISYYFACTSGQPECTDSGWQVSDATYTDTGLTPSTAYLYTVQMRDSVLNAGVATTTPLGDTTDPDLDPPLLATQTFSGGTPTATSSSSITMTATVTTDALTPPVLYQFDCTKTPTDGCNDRAWAESATHVDNGLTESTTYTYTVQAKDSSPAGNTNTLSSVGQATTPAAGAGLDLEDLIVPSSRIPDLAAKPDGVGVVGGLPDTSGWTICDTVAQGSSVSTIQTAIDDCSSGGGGVVVIAAGTTDLGDIPGNALYLKDDVVLRGAGTLATTIVGEWATGGGFGLLQFIGDTANTEALSDVALPIDDTTITIADDTGYAVGGWVIISPNNQSDFLGSGTDITYPLNSGDSPLSQPFYHYAKIAGITGTGPYTIELDRGLFMALTHGLTSGVTVSTVDFVENAGIENLVIRSDIPTDYKKSAALIDTEHAMNIWIAGNDIKYGVRQNIRIHFCVHCSIVNNLMGTPLWNVCRDDDDYGGGADYFKTGGSNGWPDGCGDNGLESYSAYNIQFGFGTQQALVANNINDAVYIYTRLSHASHWNVYSHNFTTNTLSRGGSIDTHGMFFHGGYGTDNLAESNDIDSSIDIGDEFWGKQGPRATIYRNRLRSDDDDKKVGIFTENDSGGSKIAHIDANLIGNHAFAFFNNIGCQYPTAGNVCKGVDVHSYGLWSEFNVIRDTRTSPTDAEWGFIVEPESTTDCGDGLGSASCPGTNVEALVAPGGWGSPQTPDSLYFTSEEDWEAQVGAVWCQEACDWESETGIGAFGDDFTSGTGSLCKLPAQIRDEAGTCTGVIGVDP